jgi:hypothetical protein
MFDMLIYHLLYQSFSNINSENSELQSDDQQKTTECSLEKVKRFFQKAGVEVEFPWVT